MAKAKRSNGPSQGQSKQSVLKQYPIIITDALSAWTTMRKLFPADYLFFVCTPRGEVLLQIQHPKRTFQIKVGNSFMSQKKTLKLWTELGERWNAGEISNEEMHDYNIKTPFRNKWLEVLINIKRMGIDVTIPE